MRKGLVMVVGTLGLVCWLVIWLKVTLPLIFASLGIEEVKTMSTTFQIIWLHAHVGLMIGDVGFGVLIMIIFAKRLDRWLETKG